MNNQLQIFNFEGNKIRACFRNGSVWFVFRDIVPVLRLKDPLTYFELNDDDCKDLRTKRKCYNSINTHAIADICAYASGTRARFKKWVFKTVVPYFVKKYKKPKNNKATFDELHARFADGVIRSKEEVKTLIKGYFDIAAGFCYVHGIDIIEINISFNRIPPRTGKDGKIIPLTYQDNEARKTKIRTSEKDIRVMDTPGNAKIKKGAK